MNIFNSLGSNYNLRFVLKALFAGDSDIERKKLIQYLEEKYDGKAYLFYKGRQAIEECLKSIKIPKGSYVAVNGFTCYAVYKAIKDANLNIELIDIEKNNLNFSSARLEEKFAENSNIKAVIVQNTLGYPCDIQQIEKIVKKNNSILIEDLAHSVDTIYKDGSKAGSRGDIVILSFSQDKIIDGISGGALIVRNKEIIIESQNYKKLGMTTQLKDRFYPYLTFKIRFLYKFGIGKIYHWFVKKLNILSKPMDESNQIDYLPNWYCNLVFYSFKELENNIRHRKIIATAYSKNISNKLLIENVIDSIDQSTNLRFPILINNRVETLRKLKKNGIYLSDIWYDAPIAPKRYMKKVEYKNDCPNSEFISENILNLPTHLNVSEKEAIKISEIINSCQK